MSTPDKISERLTEICLEMENIEKESTDHSLDGPIQNIIADLDYAIGVAEEVEKAAGGYTSVEQES